MDDSLLRDYRIYSQRLSRILLLGCVSPVAVTRPIAFYAMSFLPVITSSSLCVFLMNFCLNALSDLSLLTKGMYVVGSFIFTIVKAMSIAMNRKRVMELHEILNTLFEELLLDEKSKPVVLSSCRMFSRTAHSYWFLVGGTAFVYYVAPVVSIIIQHLHRVEAIKYRLPYPAKFPWTMEGSGARYQATFLGECAVGWFIVFTNCGVDTLFGFYIYQISATLRAMSRKLTDSMQKENCGKLLKDCVQKHLQLIHCCDILQRIYGPVIIFLVLVSSVIMCALIFQSFPISDTRADTTILSALYMFMKIIQTYMYAWYGSVITTESENLREGIYFSNWMESNDKDVKTQMIMMMIQKPMALTASGFFVVSVDMFTKVMQTTLSYFFLLQTLDEGKGTRE